MTPNNKELYRYIDEILFYKWDPIGISDEIFGRDEYYSYAAKVYSMVRNGAEQKEVIQYLAFIEGDYMGFGVANKARIEKVVNLISTARSSLQEVQTKS
ncbi:MAG: hypothetical protein HWE16_03515 [Gammaproteobacteria bacterium]|nr:hypothetical protein [Gammaproteobacteria bacterium]